MGLFSNLKKLKLRDIGTGKNLKKVAKGIKQMKFKEGALLLGGGLLGAGLMGGLGGTVGNWLGGAGKWIGSGAKKLFANQYVKKGIGKGVQGLLQRSIAGQAPMPPQMQMPQGMPPGMPPYPQGQVPAQTPTGQPAQPYVDPNDYTAQEFGGHEGWSGIN